MPTIGNHLRKTREGRGLSVDDVAHRARIPAKVVRRLEADDYSRFPSTAYARSYLRKYGDHLGIEVKREVRSLEIGATGSDHSEILLDSRKPLFGGWRSALPWNRPWKIREEKPARIPIFLTLIIVLLFAAVGVFYTVGYRADSYEEAQERIVEGLTPGQRPDEKSEDTVLAANEPDPPEEIRAIPIWEERKDLPSRDASKTGENGANGEPGAAEEDAPGEKDDRTASAPASPETAGGEDNDYPDGAYRQDPPDSRAPGRELNSAAASSE